MLKENQGQCVCEIREPPYWSLEALTTRRNSLCFYCEAQLKWWKIAFGSLKWWVFRWLVLVGLGNHAGRTVSQPPSTRSFTIGSEFKVYLSEAAAPSWSSFSRFPYNDNNTTTTTELTTFLLHIKNVLASRYQTLPIFPLCSTHFCMTKGGRKGEVFPLHTHCTVFENFPKSLIFASIASYVNFQKTLGFTFLPLINAFEFWQILGYLQYKKHHQEFKRIFKGQKCITKGLQSYRLIMTKARIFLGNFKHSDTTLFCIILFHNYDIEG